MARGVGVQLGAVEADSAELEQLHFTRQLQHLKEDAGQLVEEPLAEAGQGVVIGVTAGGEVAKGERVVSGALDLTVGKGAGGIAIDQQTEEHLGMIGGAAASAINPDERAKIEPFDGFENEAGQVIF